MVLVGSIGLVSAQELEYKMELGVLAGAASYMGDANTTNPFYSPSGAAGVVARYNINPRMALKGDLTWAQLKGDTEGQNVFPDGQQCAFRRNVVGLDAQFEYSFFAYGTGGGYKDSHRLSPYIVGGLGALFSPKPVDNVFAASATLGLGIKYKIAPRWNVGAEWAFRFTTTDKLDCSDPDGLQLSEPYGVANQGILKNRDGYGILMGYLSYDLFAKLRKCNNL